MRSLIISCLITAGAWGATITEEEVRLQDNLFKRYWGKRLEWRFDALPLHGRVPSERVPYSGYIYPDRAGGTANVLQKYDQAFHGGQYPATQHERQDTSSYKKTYYRYENRYVDTYYGRQLVQTRVAYTGTPHWHGHCNGWASAAIRHAEPRNNVVRNGVVFTPADIKGLLAEIYIYNETLNLSGFDFELNAGVFHAIVANWIGRAAHPIGIEADPGEEKWNYPAYEYATSTRRVSPTRVEVQLRLGYAKDSQGESQKSPRIKHTRHFSYRLDLNGSGDIVGGEFYQGGGAIDLLWIPLRPKPSGVGGNRQGNPHVNVDEVLTMWRESVPEVERQEWLVVDPPILDQLQRHNRFRSQGRLVPIQYIAPRVVIQDVIPDGGTSSSEESVPVNSAGSDDEP